MSTTPQWNADIVTPTDNVDVAENGGLSVNEDGVSVKVDGDTIVINQDGELEANIPEPATVDQVYNAESANAQSGVALAGALADYTPTASLAAVATSGAYADLSGTPNLSLKEDAANKKQSIDGTSETDFPSSKAVAQYVGDAITTNSADYISDNGQPFSSAASLPTDPTVVSNNDYAIVLSQGIYYRYKATVSGSTVTWALEYEINTSPLSQAQLNAVNSGITANKVTAYDGHVADTDIHVTTSDKSAWNAKQDAISDLDTIRSGASAGATAIQPGDLATVATSGSYTDLSNTPAIPAAQVQSDWTQADSNEVDFIKNKPNLATVATSGSYADLSNKPTIPTVDQVYGASSSNAQSGTAVAGAIAGVRQVPSTQSSDNGKVLGVTDSNGTLGWVSQPSVPATKSLVAGANISITEGSTDVTIAATDTTYTAGNCISVTNNAVAWETTAGITDIQQVAALPASPVATVLYLIPET